MNAPTPTISKAAQTVVATASDTYTKRNGQTGSIEGDDGEKCWIVSFDAMEDLRTALSTPSDTAEAMGMLREFQPMEGLGELKDWAVDIHSTSTPILTYQTCSVIEGEQAYGVLNLVTAALSPPDAAEGWFFEWRQEGENYWVPAVSLSDPAIYDGTRVQYRNARPLYARPAPEAQDEVERLTNERDEAKFVPGAWRCPKCDFRLIQSNLNAKDGSITARDEPGDKCPNCSGPLWRCSWQDEAKDAYKTAESQMDRTLAAKAALAETRGLLRYVRDIALIYWEPNTSRGGVAKGKMLQRIDAALTGDAQEASR